MWWRKLRAAWAVMLLAMLALPACQVRPLYAPAAGEPGPQADLPAVAVDLPVSREEQVYRNELLFALRGGADAAAPRSSFAGAFTAP